MESSIVAAPRPTKRDQIVAAALGLFSRRSFAATPVPLIAERAAVGAGTLYRYFPSKEALVNEVYRCCKISMGQFLAQALDSGGDGNGDGDARQRFAAIWRSLGRFADQHPEALRFLETHHHEPYLDDESRRVSDEVHARMSRFIRTSQDEGSMRRGSPDILMALVFGAFVGLVKEAEHDEHRGRFALGEAMTEAEDAAWCILRPPQPDDRPRAIKARKATARNTRNR